MGPLPTVTVEVTLLVVALITDTVLSPALATYTVPAASLTATAKGALPTWMGRSRPDRGAGS